MSERCVPPQPDTSWEHAMNTETKTSRLSSTPTGSGQLAWMRLVFAWIDAWFTTCGAYCRAAVAYEQLYRLSESDLSYRGHRRATLARDVTGFDVTHHADC
jgi:hypothetical protein